MSDYKVMADESVREYKKWAKERVKEWHDRVRPDYILLTETTAVPLGWLLKETWKGMYPDEEIPKFFRSNLGGNRNENEFYEMAESLVKSYVKKRKIEPDKTVLIFDEFDYGDETVRELFRNGEYLASSSGGTIGRNAWPLRNFADMKSIWSSSSSPKDYYGFAGKGTYLEDYGKFDKGPDKYVKPTRKSHMGGKASEAGTIEHDPQLRKRAKDWIHDLKQIGGEAGEEGRNELNLEKRLSILAISSLLLSLFFLSNNLTGHIISDYNSQVNYLGLIFFLLGLIGCFWIFKKK